MSRCVSLSDLLEEGNELTGAPLVRFGKVEVLQEQNESLAVSRSIHTPGVCRNHHTDLCIQRHTVHTLSI